MCTENQLKQVLDVVAENARSIFGTSLHSVILFGSYVRGDYDEESDIDILPLYQNIQKEGVRIA